MAAAQPVLVDDVNEVTPGMGCTLGRGVCGGETGGGRSGGIESAEGALGGGGSWKGECVLEDG